MESGCARVQIAWGPSSYKTPGGPKLDDFQRVFKLRLRTAHRSFLHLLKGHARLATRRTEAGDPPESGVEVVVVAFFEERRSRPGGRSYKRIEKGLWFFRKPETGNRKPETDQYSA